MTLLHNSEMGLWLLRPIFPESASQRALAPGDAWEPWYDKCFGMVVRAATEREAREIANANGGDETHDGKDPWLDPEQSTCVSLLAEGEPGVIIEDVHWA